MPDLPSFIGRYRVVERLSSGGMGVVYVARDAAIDRTVAVKVARVQSAELRERFLREARATGRLNHPNIVTIYDVGEHDGEPFIAMEYVPGPTLADIIRRKTPLSLAQRLRMLRELCEGLAYAHGQGIVHRDVKPANLIARDDNDALTILDFGIARLADAVTTAAGGVVGTPYYMAPEQIVGSDVDHRCDIFAVGLVFYELLSYRRAFDAEVPTAVLYKIVHEQAVSLVELMPGLSRKVVAIVDRTLAKQADDRYQNLEELLADLNEVQGVIGDEAGDADATISGSPDGVIRFARQVEEHLSNARGHLENTALTMASESVEAALQLQPASPAALRLRREIETRRTIHRHLEKAEKCLSSGDFSGASDSVREVLAFDEGHAAALKLRDRVDAVARDHRARAAVEAARAKRTAGELAAAQAILEGFDGTHDQISAELASVKAEIRQRRESFDALMAQARSHVERGNLHDARDPVRQALDSLARVEPGPSAGSARQTADAPGRPHEPGSPPPPEETVAVGASGNRPLGEEANRRRPLLAVLGSAGLAALAVAGATWLFSFGSNGRESGAATRSDTGAREAETRTAVSETPTASALGTAPDSVEGRARTNPSRPAATRAAASSPAADPDPPPPPAATPRPPASPAGTADGPGVEDLLVDAAAAEAAGNLEAALAFFDAVLRRERGNRSARTGRERVRATQIRTTVEENLRAADAAFAAGRYQDARRLFREAFDLDAAPAAAEGLRRVDNVEALRCPDDATCGTLVIRVTPRAEIFVDERSLGTATSLVLPVSAGRHRIRLETAEWRFPRALEIVAGATSEIEVDLAQDGFPK